MSEEEGHCSHRLSWQPGHSLAERKKLFISIISDPSQWKTIAVYCPLGRWSGEDRDVESSLVVLVVVVVVVGWSCDSSSAGCR